MQAIAVNTWPGYCAPSTPASNQVTVSLRSSCNSSLALTEVVSDERAAAGDLPTIYDPGRVSPNNPRTDRGDGFI